jgi:hypothetical protein
MVEEEQLGDDRVRHLVVDRCSQENNAVLQEAGIDIE